MTGSSSIPQRQTEIHDKMMEYFSVHREKPTIISNLDAEESTAQVANTSATLRSLNKKNIATYARNNYNKSSPTSGGSGVNYYDFSDISGNWDCTNFVSHALLAGGAVTYDTNGTGIASTGWYYRNLSNRSSSWSGVTFLHNFLVNNTTKGPTGSSINYTTFHYFNSTHPYQIGDILQFYQSGTFNNWRHSTIITEFYETSQTNVVGALVTGRTNKTTYNNNQKAAEVYPGEDKRVIKLAGYYN